MNRLTDLQVDQDLIVGGNIQLKDASGQNTIHLDGQTGQISIKDWSLSVPDFVLESNYALLPLDELKAYITQHQHLPDIPSASEVGESGINLGQFCMSLLKKIEELSLYLLQQQDVIQAQNDRLAQLEQSIGVKNGEDYTEA